MRNDVILSHKLNFNFRIGQLVLENWIAYGRLEWHTALHNSEKVPSAQGKYLELFDKLRGPNFTFYSKGGRTIRWCYQLLKFISITT
jgi:hypothetical protein